MMDIEHKANLHIACTTLVNVDHDYCLETLILRGKAGSIEKFSEKMGGLKGVKFAKLTKAAIPRS